MNKFLKEFILWILIVLPYAYLFTVWDTLPEKVPTHFNIKGEPDDWSDKSALLILPGALGIGIYLLMLIVPKLDPKNKIAQMGEKYYTFRFILTFFFTVLATYFVYISRSGSMQSPNMLLALIGILFAVMGNYFQAIRPNYFLGIRTPWTLENEEVWKKTHRLAGPIWVIGGMLVAILAFIINNNLVIAITFGTLMFIMIFVPIVYSYLEFKKGKS